MSTQEHDDVVRGSFTQQVGLFSGADSPFTRRPENDAGLARAARGRHGRARRCTCGAAHVAGDIAPYVRQVVGIDLTPALLAVGAERLARARVCATCSSRRAAGGRAPVRRLVVRPRRVPNRFAPPRRSLGHARREIAAFFRPDGHVVIADMVTPTSSGAPTPSTSSTARSTRRTSACCSKPSSPIWCRRPSAR